MNPQKKPRADSPLKTLPPERQAAIAEYAAGKTLEETVAWLKADGLKTSRSALSLFLSWYALRQQMARNESTVATLLQNLQTTRPDWTAEQIQQVGQSFFSALALEQQDADVWNATQQIQLKREQLALERQKFQRDTCALFVKWTADQRAKDIAASDATHADKIEQLGQLMFGPDWKQ